MQNLKIYARVWADLTGKIDLTVELLFLGGEVKSYKLPFETLNEKKSVKD